MNEMNQVTDPTTAEFFVGDLCYVLTRDEWDIVCYATDFSQDQNTYAEEDGYDCESFLDPEAFDWGNYDAVKPYYIFRTAYGDGVYNDKEGNPYSVDSGTIGCIRTDFITDKEALERAVSNGLGHIHYFDEEFSSGWCYYDNGVIGFDTVEIDTSGATWEEEEEEEEDADW